MAKRLALPNGATVQIASALGAEIVFTAITNANPASVDADAHGLVAGDYVMVNSGWCELDGRVFKVGVTDVDTFTLIGANTTKTTKYPPGSGAGTVQKVMGWVDLPCITDSATNGGEAQYTEVACLQEDSPTNLPNGFSALTWNLTVADDDDSEAIEIIEELSEDQEASVIRVILRTLKETLYPGLISITPVGTLTRGEAMTRVVGVAVTKITKYKAP